MPIDDRYEQIHVSGTLLDETIPAIKDGDVVIRPEIRNVIKFAATYRGALKANTGNGKFTSETAAEIADSMRVMVDNALKGAFKKLGAELDALGINPVLKSRLIADAQMILLKGIIGKITDTEGLFITALKANDLSEDEIKTAQTAAFNAVLDIIRQEEMRLAEYGLSASDFKAAGIVSDISSKAKTLNIDQGIAANVKAAIQRLYYGQGTSRQAPARSWPPAMPQPRIAVPAYGLG